MPKKRNAAWSRTKKEKQIITTRLIEISLKVDDYIYKHKPISVWEAEQYIREVSSYKVQCSRDERSLQVIEKLIRCMRAIILDHQELRTDNHSTNNDCSIPGVIHAGSVSPVYSIPDEDRTQFSQAEGSNDNVEIIDLSNIEDDDDSMNNATNNTTDYGGTKITAAVDIHRHMSSLSLRVVDKPPDMQMSSEANCSQSILDNFDGAERMQQNEINMTPQGAVADVLVGNVTDTNVMENNSIDKIPEKNITSTIEPTKTIKSAITPNKPIIICNAENNLNFKTVVPNKEPLRVTKATNYGVTYAVNEQNNITSQAFYPPTNNNIPENQRQTRYDSNRTCTINNSNHTLTDANNFTQPRQIYKDGIQLPVTNSRILNGSTPTNKLNTAGKNPQAIATEISRTTLQNNEIITNAAVVQEYTEPTKKKRRPKKKLTDENDIKTNKKVVRRNSKSNKENTPTNRNKNITIPIYNENVVDDLSWVENIRYVREIRVDENDSKLSFEESFWDNYYLPANWSENEFV